jgi:anaerobic ribonucleoside-triphosphate reductase activating protein
MLAQSDIFVFTGRLRMDDLEMMGIPNSGSPLSMQMVNVAATCPATRSLGPGIRSVVWVQGCAFHCPGCIAPDWIPIRPARFVYIEDLVEELLVDPRVTGITFSGGEPMLQAVGLARFARLARKKRDLDIICFTGFQLAYLEDNPPGPGVDDLLSQVDVLIDGPYIARLNDNIGLRGSRNQKIHYLTKRLCNENLETISRTAEIHIMDGQAMLVGVPPARLGEAYNQAINTANGLQMRLIQYERI